MKAAYLAGAAALVLVAGCSGSGPAKAHHQAAALTSTPSAAASPTRPAGCDQVGVVVGTVRGELENAPDDSTFNQAAHQLAALGKSIPEGPLRIDVDRTNFDMTQYWLRLSSGESGTRWAKAFGADLRRLGTDCA